MFMFSASYSFFFFFQAEDGIRDPLVTGVQTCALPIFQRGLHRSAAQEGRGRGGARERLRTERRGLHPAVAHHSRLPSRGGLRAGPQGAARRVTARRAAVRRASAERNSATDLPRLATVEAWQT